MGLSHLISVAKGELPADLVLANAKVGNVFTGEVENKVNIKKPPMTATQRGMGAGIGKTKTVNFGLITVNTPATAKTAPEAPTAMEKGDAKSR